MTREVLNGFSLRELETEQVLTLPERAAMSLVNANAAIPINAAVALNVLSDASTATADANQDTPIDQALAKQAPAPAPAPAP